MLGTWGVDIEESNNFILIYIVIFMMTYAVGNVSYEAISKITSDNRSKSGARLPYGHRLYTSPCGIREILTNEYHLKVWLWYCRRTQQYFEELKRRNSYVHHKVSLILR